MVTLEHLKEFHPEVEVYSSDSLWLDREVACFTLSRITTRHFIMISFFFFIHCPNTVMEGYIQPGHPYISFVTCHNFLSLFLAIFLSFSFLPSVCGLIDYIFLTLYLGGKWAGNLQHPLRGYFIIMDPEKNSQKLCTYMCLFIMERLVAMDPEKISKKVLQIFANLFPIFHTKI